MRARASPGARRSRRLGAPRGELGLLADARRQMLVGAWAVGPLAGEWIHYAALAIKIETPLRGLHDTVAQFRTFTEAYLKGWSPLRSRPRVDPRRPRKEEAHAADG